MPRPATLFALFGCLTITTGCQTDQSASNRSIVRGMIEAVNARDFDALDTLIADDVRRHSGATPGLVIEDLEGFKAFLRTDLKAVPDAQQEINLILSEGDLVAVHVSYRGTQDGPMGPFPASGLELELPFIGLLRIEDGRVAEMWVEWDNMNALTQLGHFPPPPADTESAEAGQP